MLSLICSIIAVTLAALSVKQYKFVSTIVAMEFALHYIAYNYLFLDFRESNKATIFVMYMVIQACAILAISYRQPRQLAMAVLIFIDLTYNFLLVLRYLHITDIDFHIIRDYVKVIIMITELVLMAGMVKNVYGNNKLPKYLNIAYFDSLFRNRYRSVTWNKNRATA